jgi:hypothetical protein
MKIVIIVFNLDGRVFDLQIESIKKFCLDNYSIHIYDNSSDDFMSDVIYHKAMSHEVNYTRVTSEAVDPSHSHAYAANYAFNDLYHDTEYFFFLDHDCIPVKTFSVVSILGNNIAAGVQQGFETKYFWAGMFMFNNHKVKKQFINFNPIHKLRIDTGGMNYKIFRNYPKECVWLDEVGVKNETIEDEFYYYYLMLNNRGFIHFINTSNWRGVPNTENRITSLIEITKNLINDNIQ